MVIQQIDGMVRCGRGTHPAGKIERSVTGEYAMVYLASGCLDLLGDAGGVTLVPGQLFQRRPGCVVEVRYRETCDCLWMAVPGAFRDQVRACAPELGRSPVLDVGCDWRFVSRHRSLMRLLAAHAHDARLQVSHRIQGLMIEVLERDQQRRLARTGCDWVAEACRRLEGDWNTRLSAVADAVGMPYARFRSAFSAAMGLPPGRYRIAARMRQAMVLLDEGASVTAVAEAVGYPDPQALSRQFKRFAGVSPGRWATGRDGTG